MLAKLFEALYVVTYVFLAPAVIWLLHLGSLAWLVYASALAVIASGNLHAARSKLP